ncbi:MAG TPA: hypothetical protein VM009_00110 [Terriglobales bacterium]|nr:hypothetical protein [Terriglobales bacterium]
MPAQDPVRELLDLVAVHKFYIATLETQLKHPVPLPKEADNPSRAGSQLATSIQVLRHWLAVLDMAVDPLLIRDALKANLPIETAEALIRYFMEKVSHRESDRDKADFMATYLFRNSPEGKAEVPHTQDRFHYITKVAATFEQELFRILGDGMIPALREEHAQLVREFEFLHQEVEDFRTFDQLMDSGIVQRVRDIKQTFAESFYHPRVISNVAVYNAIFGQRFDELLHHTTEQLKTFAEKVQDEGASIMSRVEGDVTVKHLADIQEDHIKTQEYGKAQAHFHKISKFKKVVDSKGHRGGKAAAAASAPIPPKTPFSSSPNIQAAGARPAPPTSIVSSAARVAGMNEVEEGKVRNQLDTMRTFVRVADKSCFVIPLTKGSLNISAHEAEALRADYGNEKSFRADYANLVCYMMAIMARLAVEIHEFREKQNSSYLWKPHADAMTYFLNSASRIYDRANVMMDTAKQRGLEEKANLLLSSVTKLKSELQRTATTLQSVGSGQKS